MAEMKKAYDEYDIKCDDGVHFDQKKITSNDLKKKQFSTSYTTDKYKVAGSLVVKKFQMDKDDGNKLIGIVFDVVAPAKTDKKDETDAENEYTVTCTLCQQ
eukprot:221376_1